MKRKPIRIAWQDLELAFDNSNEELVYYLDLVNGHVFLEGEGEEGAFEEDEESFDANPPAASPAAKDNTRAPIDRLTPETKIDWVQRFLDEEPSLDPGFSAALSEALDSEDPTREIGDLLTTNAEGKDRWYRFRADRLHERIDEWLEHHQVALIDPPPWR